MREKKTHKKIIHEKTTTTIGEDGKELKKHEKTVTEETVTVIKRSNPHGLLPLSESSSTSSSEQDSRLLTKIKEESVEHEEDSRTIGTVEVLEVGDRGSSPGVSPSSGVGFNFRNELQENLIVSKKDDVKERVKSFSKKKNGSEKRESVHMNISKKRNKNQEGYQIVNPKKEGKPEIAGESPEKKCCGPKKDDSPRSKSQRKPECESKKAKNRKNSKGKTNSSQKPKFKFDTTSLKSSISKIKQKISNLRGVSNFPRESQPKSIQSPGKKSGASQK